MGFDKPLQLLHAVMPVVHHRQRAGKRKGLQGFHILIGVLELLFQVLGFHFVFKQHAHFDGMQKERIKYAEQQKRRAEQKCSGQGGICLAVVGTLRIIR